MTTSRRSAGLFIFLCGAAEIALLLFDRPTALVALGATAYGLLLWSAARYLTALDLGAEERVLKTIAKGWRLWTRVAIVVVTLGAVFFGRQWFWVSPMNAAIQRFSVGIGLGNGDTALPNALFYVIVPGLLLFLCGARRAEVGVTAWRRGSGYVLLAALVLPAAITILWASRGHAAFGLLSYWFAHNFLSNGFSEEFLMRGMTMSHLRAFFPKSWALTGQALLFGIFHLNGFQKPDNWALEAARVIALNTPLGYFLGLIALRSGGVVLPGLIHTTLDTMQNLLGA